MSKTHQLPEIPWCHLWSVDELDSGDVQLSLSPSPSEMKQLQSFLDLKTIDNFECALHIKRHTGKHVIHVQATIQAQIEQDCVHSLESVSSSIHESFDAYFADRDQAVPFSKAKKELFSKYGVDDMPILDEQEDPEPIVNGQIDLGGLIVQFLSLAIDPYPHVEGTQSQFQSDEDENPSSKRENPFAALKDWNKGETS